MPIHLDSVAVYVYLALWLFFLYALAGVLVEMLYCWIVEFPGVIEARLGILYLPFNPLYGIGGVVITLALVPFVQDPVVVFVVGLLVGSVIEYVTSWVMEKAFHAVYWDYSNEFLNIKGRVCLKYSLMWGALSLVLLYVLDKVNVAAIATIPGAIGIPILAVLSVATVLSILLTLAAFRRLRQKNAWLRARQKDPSAVLRTSGVARLVDRLVPDGVLINSFPRMSLVVDYERLSGHTRKLIVWRPTFGKPNEVARLAALRTKAVEQEFDAGDAAARPA